MFLYFYRGTWSDYRVYAELKSNLLLKLTNNRYVLKFLKIIFISFFA